MASSYAADPACSFLAMTTNSGWSSGCGDSTEVDDDTILAVANYKRLNAQNVAWIEAVRTHPRHRNMGLATALLRSIIDLSKEENDSRPSHDARPTRILTCTIRSNRGMLRALEKVGFVQCNTIPALQWKVLKELPGWAPNCDKSPRPLLDALDLKHLVSPIAKTATPWSTISSEQQLLEWLALCKNVGGCCGYLPGLYEYIVPGPNRADLKESMESGLVLGMDFRTHPESSCLNGAGIAILVFTRDERISSLKSKWVCSIVAHNQLAFEAALWYAHSNDVASRMRSFHCDGDKVDNLDPADESATALPFCLVFDDAVPLNEGTLSHALPRVTDECVVFSYQHE
jgi:GNAT superfamily N-acetyltransferase